MITDSENLYLRLEEELRSLPGEVAHKEMYPTRITTSEQMKVSDNYKLSAVLALLYFHCGDHYLLLTERQDYKGNHSGQMSFPGGKIEPHDENSMVTALREMEEEVGIPKSQVKIIGNLSDVYIPVSNFLVHVYVGVLPQKPITAIDEREVKQVVTIPIKDILNLNSRIITDISIGNGSKIKNIPAFNFEGKIVWGATGLMINELRIVLSRFYR